MKKEYGKSLRKLFPKAIIGAFPYIEEVKIKSYYLFPGHRPFLWKMSDHIYGWIVLEQDAKGYDQFNVLIGWSKLARYPELSMVPVRRVKPCDSFSEEEYLCRLPSLWTDKDLWWKIRLSKEIRCKVPSEGAKNIPVKIADNIIDPLVSDSIEKLHKYGMPYLRELLKHESELG